MNQSKVFKAHAVPQGHCGTLKKALKLPANQTRRWRRPHTEHCDKLGKGSRKGLTNGLREFIKIDTHRALEVGHLREGLGSFKVRRPKAQEGYPEVTVRESPDELTLRAEEVGTWKSYINVDHTAKERLGSFPWLMPTGMPSVRRCIKASKEETGEGCMRPTKK